MIDNLMPDIPRIYTAIAEWAACMIFITSLKKRYTGWTTGGIVIGLLIVQCLRCRCTTVQSFLPGW